MSLTTDASPSAAPDGALPSTTEPTPATPPAPAPGSAPMEVHRDGRIAGPLGLVACATAIAWLSRAGGGGSWVDWLVCAVTATVGVTQLLALADARTPLLAADEQGIRVRLAREWLGLPWSTLEQVLVEEREGPVRDGRLVLVPRQLEEVLGAVLPSSRRTLAWQRRLHGAPLAVPLSVATRTTGGDVVATLRRLSQGRTEIVVVRGRGRADLSELTGRPTPVALHQSRVVEQPADEQPSPEEPAAEAHGDEQALPLGRKRWARLLGRLAGEPAADLLDTSTDPTAAGSTQAAVPGVPPVAALRQAREVVRSEIVRPGRIRPEHTDTPLAVDAPRVEQGEHVEQGVEPAFVTLIGEDAPVPVVDPVIGPQVREARLRARLEIDELSDRTRIRPHVLEGIEVDDFGPCGGDFYARGHLRTLARYLGLDGEELVAAYDERYSHAPVNARRVFEAELATGISGGMRATSGGPRWSLIAAAVLALALVWGVARFLTDEPSTMSDPVVTDSAGLAANHQPITPVATTRPMTVKAIGARTHVVVHDRTGAVLWSGTLHRGESRSMAGVAPFTVQATNAAATRVEVGRHWLGPVGQASAKGSRTVG